MRILIVAESSATVDTLQTIFRSETGYETFAYSILLKALDNIEEIRPDIVVLSAADFPRHWKLFVRYLRSPLFQPIPSILLLTDKKFDDEEQQKADVLGVHKIVADANLSQYTTIGSLLQDTAEKVEATPMPLGPRTPRKLSDRVQCSFTDPKTGALVTGTVTSCGKNTFTFVPDAISIAGFAAGDSIRSCLLTIDGFRQSAVLQVIGVEAGKIKLKVRHLQA
jgi:CheY-like chemotaxis protein